MRLKSIHPSAKICLKMLFYAYPDLGVTCCLVHYRRYVELPKKKGISYWIELNGMRHPQDQTNVANPNVGGLVLSPNHWPCLQVIQLKQLRHLPKQRQLYRRSHPLLLQIQLCPSAQQLIEPGRPLIRGPMFFQP